MQKGKKSRGSLLGLFCVPFDFAQDRLLAFLAALFSGLLGVPFARLRARPEPAEGAGFGARRRFLGFHALQVVPPEIFA
jgi:hypothetical protein